MRSSVAVLFPKLELVVIMLVKEWEILAFFGE